MATRPFPPWSAAGRHVEVHLAQQVLLLVDGGRVVRAIHVSTAARAMSGRRHPLTVRRP